MKEKIIFTNGLIDLAQPRLGTRVLFKTDDFLHQLIELLVLQIQFLKQECLIRMENGWTVGNQEEEEQRAMII